MLAAGQSVLVVARGIKWAQTRGYLTVPTPSVKEQPPSNVWFPFLWGWVPLQPCHHLSLVPKENGKRKQTNSFQGWVPLNPHPTEGRAAIRFCDSLVLSE